MTQTHSCVLVFIATWRPSSEQTSGYGLTLPIHHFPGALYRLSGPLPALCQPGRKYSISIC